jgi:prolyl-tRNA synthetase
MIHGDDKGLVLPPKLAPIQVVIIPIYYSKEDREKMVDEASKVKDALSSVNIRAHLDDRDQLTPGFKFHDWELKGIPIRIEIGPKDVAKNQVVIVRRHNQTKTSFTIENVSEYLTLELEKIQKQMFEDAKKILDDRVVKASEYEQFKKELDDGKMIDCGWCGKQECEDKIKEETAADLRVIPSDNQQKSEVCIYCQEKSITNALFARGY